ncbi:MAG TPA: DUF721 domain-containing protein [Gaiellales bacterium]|nr:DUF721 domain-containing protein [Gaiellales bacterium]
MSDLRRIDSLLPGLPGGRRDETAAAARAVWPRAAGEQVARNSHPIRMTGDVLVVHCTSSTWAAELTMLSGQVLAALAAEMGAAAPAGLRFEVGELPQAAPAAADEVVAVAPDRGRLRRARRIAEGLPEGTLRDAVERAYATSPEADS